MALNEVLAQDLEQIYGDLGNRAKLGDSAVLITGCAGFLGFYAMQFLTRNAKRLGIRQVVGLDTFLLNRPQWLDTLKREYGDVVSVREFDIAKDDIASAPFAAEAKFVIHAASIASPTFYRKYPLQTIDANIWGLRRLLDFYSARKSLRGLLFFSSSEIYGDPPPEAVPTREDYRGHVACLGPRACYDESKRFGETLCQVFATTRHMPITIARPFNNYGPGMRLGDRRLPADLASCIVEGRDIEILSDGSPTRTFCYISDAMTGYLLCLLHGQFDVFNIGVEEPEISVADVARLYQRAGAALFAYQGEIRFARSSDPDYLKDNPNRRCPVIARAREKLGYSPKVEVADGIKRYLRFLKDGGAVL